MDLKSLDLNQIYGRANAEENPREMLELARRHLTGEGIDEPDRQVGLQWLERSGIQPDNTWLAEVGLPLRFKLHDFGQLSPDDDQPKTQIV